MLLLVFSALHTVLAPVCNLFRCICLSRKDFGDGLDTAPRRRRSWLCAQPSSPPLWCGHESTGNHFFCFTDSRVWQYMFLKFPIMQNVAQELIHFAIYLSVTHLFIFHCRMTYSFVFWHLLVASFQLECLAQLIPLFATAGKQGLSSSLYNPISTDHFYHYFDFIFVLLRQNVPGVATCDWIVVWGKVKKS